MNSEIDITQFGSAGGQDTAVDVTGLVRPPRRIFSRYILPLLLLAGFAGVAAFAFRGAFVTTIDVDVTMPVPAPEKYADLADDADFAVEAVPVAAAPVSAMEGRARTVAATPEAEPHQNLAAERPRGSGAGKALFQAPGWIEPSPFPIVISSLRNGTIKTIEVIEGQRVTPDTVVARLVDDDDLLAIRMHESTLKLKQAKYDAARHRWENPTDLVEAVNVATATGGKLEAQARRLRDQTQFAELDAQVGSTLTRGGYEASLETARRNTQLSVSRNELQETRAEIALNSATLHAASERMRLRIEDREALETAEAELMEAKVALEQAKLQWERSVIKAPTTGTIMRLHSSPGSMLTGDMIDGTNIAQMYRPDELQVRVDVPLAEAARVRPGLPAEIRVEALPDRRFRGELINIVPQFDLQKNVLPVKVRVFDPDEALRPEMIARVEFFANQPIAPSKKPLPDSAPKLAGSTPETTVETSAKAESKADNGSAAPQAGAEVASAEKSSGGDSSLLMFPADALRPAATGAGKEILIVDAENIARAKRVEVLATAEGMALVQNGIRITDKIIVRPEGVAPGRTVRIQKVVENGSH